MDLKDVSEFIRQLREAGFPTDTIMLNKKTLKPDDFGATIDIINPQTKYILYRFECEPEAGNDKEDKSIPAHGSSRMSIEESESAAASNQKSAVRPTSPHPSRQGIASRKRQQDRGQRIPAPLYSFLVDCPKPRKGDAPAIFALTTVVRKAATDDTRSKSRQTPDIITIADLPPLYAVKNASEAMFAKRRKEAAIEKVDTFALAMYIPAGALVVFTILNALGLFVLGEMQYAMLGAALLLFILPQTKSLKLLGIEFERYIPDETADQKAAGSNGEGAQNAPAAADARSPMNKLVGTSPAIKKLFDDGLDPK